MLQLQLHYFTLHYTRLITLRYNYNYITLHYTNYYTTPHHDYNCNCECTPLITLHYNYNSSTLRYNYNSTTLQLQLQLRLRYTTLHPAVVVRWPLQTLQPLQNHNSNHLSVHEWIRSAIRDSQQPTSHRLPTFETTGRPIHEAAHSWS